MNRHVFVIDSPLLEKWAGAVIWEGAINEINKVIYNSHSLYGLFDCSSFSYFNQLQQFPIVQKTLSFILLFISL